MHHAPWISLVFMNRNYRLYRRERVNRAFSFMIM